jgi:hypothetical protein
MAELQVLPSRLGPYDKNANTYYNVGSMSGWTAENQKVIKGYNDYILQILNIHEAFLALYAVSL